MTDIKIAIKNKIPTLVDKNAHIVTYNGDYSLTFEFDEEWEEYSVKNLLIIANGEKLVDKEFTGNTVELEPLTTNSAICKIGVYAGDLRTTVPVCVYLWQSIYSYMDAPDIIPDGYMELMSKISGLREQINDTVMSKGITVKTWTSSDIKEGEV